MPKKYKMVYDKNAYHPDGKRLYRIVALREGPWGPKGTKGGLIEKAANLDHEGDCWIGEHGMASGNARVSGNAYIDSSAGIYDDAIVTDDAEVYGTANIGDKCEVRGNSRIGPNVHLAGRVIVDGFKVLGQVRIMGEYTVKKDLIGFIRIPEERPPA